jgi:hypothetical protein
MMGRRTLVKSLACLALAITQMGCGAVASWKEVQFVAGNPRPHEVTIAVRASAEGADVASLELALLDAFGKRDIRATLSDDENARPDLRVVIEQWSPGSQDARATLAVTGAVVGLPGLRGLGAGEIVVGVKATRENGESFIEGKAHSVVDRNVRDSLHAIAELIATAVATGEAWPEAARQKPHGGYP